MQLLCPSRTACIEEDCNLREQSVTYQGKVQNNCRLHAFSFSQRCLERSIWLLSFIKRFHRNLGSVLISVLSVQSPPIAELVCTASHFHILIGQWQRTEAQERSLCLGAAPHCCAMEQAQPLIAVLWSRCSKRLFLLAQLSLAFILISSWKHTALYHSWRLISLVAPWKSLCKVQHK